MGVGSRRLEVDTKWLKDYGVIAAKDFLTPDQFYKYENQSEEKINKVREPRRRVRAQAARGVGGICRWELFQWPDEIYAISSTIWKNATSSRESKPKWTGTKSWARSPARCRANMARRCCSRISPAIKTLCAAGCLPTAPAAKSACVGSSAWPTHAGWRNRARVQRSLRQAGAPVMVSSGPVKDNIVKGDDVDLYQLPVPKWNPLDGGRYIMTSGSVVTRDPDNGTLNVGTYRGMIGTKNTIGVLLATTQGWGTHFTKQQQPQSAHAGGGGVGLGSVLVHRRIDAGDSSRIRHGRLAAARAGGAGQMRDQRSAGAGLGRDRARRFYFAGSRRRLRSKARSASIPATTAAASRPSIRFKSPASPIATIRSFMAV